MSKLSDHAQEIADLLIQQLEKDNAPWQKPWNTKLVEQSFNASTGNAYKGSNALLLKLKELTNEYNDPRWLTYKQADALGCQVKKGEKSSKIIHYKFDEEKKVKQPDGSFKKEVTQLETPRAFSANVFNASQISGLEPYVAKELVNWNPIERAENILNATQANIKHDQIDKAFYKKSTDSIHLPVREAFGSEEQYYSTALHELSHWTGNESRLNRPLAGQHNKPEYAKEELRAEIGSMLIKQQIGIPMSDHCKDQHASYVKSWIKVLEKDPNEIILAARDAEKIQKYVLDFEKTLEHEQQVVLNLDEVSSTNKLLSENISVEIFTSKEAASNQAIAILGSDTAEAKTIAALVKLPVIKLTDEKQIDQLLQTENSKGLVILGNKDQRSELKDEERVHVITQSNLNYEAKSWLEAFEKPIQAQNFIKTAQEGLHHRITTKELAAKDLDKGQVQEID